MYPGNGPDITNTNESINRRNQNRTEDSRGGEKEHVFALCS